jgi:plastocyanin
MHDTNEWKKRIASVARATSLAGGVLILASLLPQPIHAQMVWHAAVGAQNHDKGHQALAFLPNEIWIHAGDSVMWQWDTDEIHTLSFLRPGQTRQPFPFGCGHPPATVVFATDPATVNGVSPCVSTPPLVKGQSFTVQFPNAGNFEMVCLVHPNMTGVVHVLVSTEPLPHNQSFYDDQAADHGRDLLSDDRHETDHDMDHLKHGSPRLVTAGIGEVTATAGGFDTLSVMRFVDGSVVIHAGDTVEWTNLDPATPHTITFGTEPADPMPPSANVGSDPDGARHVVINSPTDSAHSGFISAPPQERIGLAQAPLGVTRFRVTFPNKGVYPYICALHDDLGMKGTITVR